MVVSASRTTQSAGSASRFAPGSGGRDGASGRAGTAASVRTFSCGWAVGACAQAEPGSSASKPARSIFFMAIKSPGFLNGLAHPIEKGSAEGHRHEKQIHDEVHRLLDEAALPEEEPDRVDDDI